MNIPFDQISSKSRVWIYQADRALSVEEITQLTSKGVAFIDNWEAHGKTLQASIHVFHKQFIVIAVDENYNMTTGCSIDSSVAFVRSISSEFGIELFDRTKIAFLIDNQVYLAQLKDIKTEIQKGIITSETFTFNNLLADKEAFENQWLTPVKNTWLSRYF